MNSAKILPARLAAAWRAVPLGQNDDGSITVACATPADVELQDNLGLLLNAPIQLTLASDQEIEKALQERYGTGATAIDELSADARPEESPLTGSETSDVAMVRFVNDLIRQAAHERATDIHIEPFEDDVLIRFRVDGLLHPITLPKELRRFQNLLASRIKVMAQMNIAEKRLPQDGRIRFTSGGTDVDIRVSTIPTIYGETIDLRLLPRQRMILGLEELGMSEENRAIMNRLIRKPNGLLLVTGPTGHGKTTTLYACLSQINTPEKKIVTIEDPVEVRLKGVNQIQTHAKIGLDFASGLRSVLRQDPDVIMVGEIRDTDTAEIAIRASLTGHLVFSTLHTNDAVGAVTRLIDMGVEPYLVASSLSAVVAQRLVRLSGAAGGRTGIFELLVLDEEIRSLILKRAPASLIRDRAIKKGMFTLHRDGRRKVGLGETTDEELFRVTEDQ